MFAKAVANGINLQTNTPVTSISEDLDSRGRRTVYTPRGCIKAKKIVVLTNAYTSAILPEYKDKIIPYRAICSRIVAPEKPPELLTTYALRFADWDFDYLIPRADGSIIVGGARRDFFRDIKQWYGRTDDDTVVEPAKHYFDGYMQRHFAGWEDSGAYTDNVWTGSKSFTRTTSNNRSSGDIDLLTTW
jgi:glycine/D-amino acid oxidase-like deaminating enzyme